MVVGVLGAIAQDDIKRILSFNIVSQIGYMVMGLAFFSVAGVGGDLLRDPPHRGKTTLFLIGGLVEHAGGSHAAGPARQDGPHGAGARRAVPHPARSASPAIPPLSGFVAKLALIDAGFVPAGST